MRKLLVCMSFLSRVCTAVIVSILLVPLCASAAELGKGEKDTIFIGSLKAEIGR